MGLQRTLNSQSNLDKEDELEESTCLTSDYTIKLQSSKSMVLAQRQTQINGTK